MVWLPKGFEFLAGLPERKRRKRPIVIFQAYVDDSGTKGDGPVMVIAAIVGAAEVWAEVSDAWDKELRSSATGRLAYFKEDEAHHLSGQFRHWRPEARDVKVKRFSNIVDRPDLFVVWYALDLDSHRAASKFAGKPFKDAKRHGGNQPYLLLMPTVIMAVATATRQRNPAHKRVELFLDEHNVFKADILNGYPDMLRALETIDPAVRERMPSQPWFRDDSEFLPLQAADLIAGSVRRGSLGYEKRATGTMTKLRVWPGSKLLGGDEMLRFAQAHTRQKLVNVRIPRPKRKAGKRR